MGAEQRKVNHLLWRAAFGPVAFRHFSKKQSLEDYISQLTDPALPQYYLDFSDKAIAELQKKSGMEGLERAGNKLIRRLTFIGTNHYWFSTMVNSNHDLHERMTLFWAGLFACQTLFARSAEDYINTIREHALGKFPDLLSAVSKHPAMLRFLNNQQNRKEHPNENFAREVMELFTLGRGHYTEKDIREAARAFTGWSSDSKGNFVFRKNNHDDGVKEFLGQTGHFNGDDILRIITGMRQCARYITQRIFIHFVNDQPDANIIESLADSFFRSGYDIRKLMHSIFSSDWFYDPKNMGIKIKSPVVLMVNLSRNFNIRFADHAAALRIQKILGQVLLYPPNVAGWPEGKNWIDSSTLLYRLNLPALLMHAANAPLKPKREFDMQLQELEAEEGKERIKIFSDTSDFDRAFSSLSSSQLADALVSLFIQTENSHEIIRMLSQSEKKDPAGMALELMSLPEFQLC